MTRPLLVLLLTLAQFSVDAAPRRRAAQQPAPPSAALVAAAHQVADAALAAGVPAVQIAVSRRGDVIYSEAFGLTDRETATAATPRSVMQIASNTKQFTAAAILRLAERGALTLDDRIETFVPEFDARGTTITLRHLLTHTSGLARDQFPPGSGSNGLPPNYLLPLSRESYIKQVNAQAREFAPGTGWTYSNSGYMLLGYAIESVTGRTFGEFIRSEFVLPLGLIDTGVCGTDGLPLPEGYGVMQGTWMRFPAINRSIVFSAGALCSTATDLVRWSHLLGTGQVILPASYATMTTPVTVPDKIVDPYGLGVYSFKQLGRPAVMHVGGYAGFRSVTYYFPDEDLAVALIMNALPLPAGVDGNTMAVTIAKAVLPAL